MGWGTSGSPVSPGSCRFLGVASPEKRQIAPRAVSDVTAGTRLPMRRPVAVVHRGDDSRFTGPRRGHQADMTHPQVRPSLAAVILRKEAIGAGLTDRDIARLVRAGDWHRIRHGAYCDGSLWRGLDPGGKHMLLARAVVRQARTEVVLSHVSAVPEYGGPVELLPLDEVHETRFDQRAGRAEAGVRQHQGVLRPEDVVVVGDLAVTSPTRTAIDITTVADIDASAAVVRHLLEARHTTIDRVRARYASMVNHPHTGRTEAVLRRVER